MTGQTRGVPPRLTFERGFTLTELAIVLLIVALMIGGMLIPLAAQDDIRRSQETQKLLKDAAEALIGYAAANGRLPCPATLVSNGQESPVGLIPSVGNCSNFYDGYLPAAALGLAPTNQNGLLVDAWNQPIRYAVFAGAIGTVSNPMTRTNGIRDATMPQVAAAVALSVCGSATGIAAAACGTAPKLTDKAPAVLFSTGKNGVNGAAGADESANLNGDVVFVSHDPTPAGSVNGEFDDLVVWISSNILFNRLITAGRLP